MDEQEKQTIIKNTLEIIKEDSFNKVFKVALGQLSLSKKRVLLLIIVFIVSLLPSHFMIFSKNSVTVFSGIISSANGVIIALFAIIFTGYALFQALVSGNALKQMLLQNAEKYSMFKEYNLFFFILTIEYLFFIILNFGISFLLSILPANWSFPYFSDNINSIIAILFVSLYIVLVVNAILEVKCFIYNLYQCFSINAFANIMEKIEKDK